MRVVGLDVGGANLKAADADGHALATSFAVWKAPEKLWSAMRQLLSSFAPPDAVAVTMTAELADCYRTKAEGVDAVLRAVERACPGTPVYVWQTGAEFVSSQTAGDIPLLVAAANWHALATWVGRMVSAEGALLLDIGSTTSDVIPLLRKVPVPSGLTDRERLLSGELVYSGVRRTPVAAVADSMPFRGRRCPIAAEAFATTLDVYLLRGEIGESAHDCDTANGKPATIDAARDRLARMLCTDRSEFAAADARLAADFLAEAQRTRLRRAVEHVLDELDAPCGQVLISGTGEFLARKTISETRRLEGAEVTSLAEHLGADIAGAACAFAVARLAAERLV